MSSLFRKPASEPEADGQAEAPARGGRAAAAALASARTGLLTMAGRVSALAARKSAVAEADRAAMDVGGNAAAPGSQSAGLKLASAGAGLAGTASGLLGRVRALAVRKSAAASGGAALNACVAPSDGGGKTAASARMANLKLYASLAAAVIWALFLELCRLLLRLSKRLVRLIARRRGRTKPTGTDGKLPARRGSYLRLAKALLKLGLAAAAVLAVGAGIGYILQLMNPLIR